MTVLVGVATNQVDEFVAQLLLYKMQALHELAPCHAINGKHIDIDASHIGMMLAFDEGGITVHHLTETAGIVRIALRT